MTKFPRILFVAFAAALFAASAAMAASELNINKPRGAPAQAPAVKNMPRFAKSIDDLPLMPGLTPEEDKDVLFIAGPARIAQTTATGMVDIDEVYYYYERSLPELGWKKVDARTYERNGERLRLDVSGANPGGITMVRFSVEPVAAKGK